MSNTSTVSGPLRQFHPVIWQKTFTDGPTSARSSKLLSRGATGVLKSTGSISRVYTASTRSISGFCTADTLYSQVFRGSILLRILRYLQHAYCSYSQYSQYYGLRYCSYSQYSQYSGLQYCSYSQYSQYEMYPILRVYSKYEVHWEHL